MRRVIVFIYFSLISVSSFAWWEKEHQIVAIIAEENLSIKAKQQVNKLLEGRKLHEVANWADTIKRQSRWSHSKRWHYMNLKQGETVSDYKVLVGGDILWALNYFYGQLNDKGKSLEQQREALMFFIHLFGDIHQPLHVGKLGDAGGNRESVRWKDEIRLLNLHKVWDGLLTQSDLSAKQYARKISKSSMDERVTWSKASFEDCAQESLQLHKSVYKFGLKNKDNKILKLDNAYQILNKPVVEKRLLQAGIRLAHYLNLAFK